MPDKRSNARIKPLALASSHGRHTRAEFFSVGGMAAAYSRYKFIAASLLERLRNGHFNSETAVRRLQE
jgi:hypothetical protein